MIKRRKSVGIVLAVVLGLVSAPQVQAEPAVPVVQPVVLGELTHDPAAFTEGLELGSGPDGPTLYEGTGLEGSSQLRELDPVTGALRRAVDMPGKVFGEGITVVGDRIWQLTYEDGIAVEWDKATLTAVRQVPLSPQGWGLCRDGDRLIRSDGTSRLRFHNPADLTETGGIDVTRDGEPVTGLNELECVDGQVWANAWPTDTIVRIDPASGKVNLVVDAGMLRSQPGIPPTAQVLNGIAHITGDEFLLTGKDWPKTFRVRLG